MDVEGFSSLLFISHTQQSVLHFYKCRVVDYETRFTTLPPPAPSAPARRWCKSGLWRWTRGPAAPGSSPVPPDYTRTEPNSVLPIQFITASTAIEPWVIAPSRDVTERWSATPAGRVARRSSWHGPPTPAPRRAASARPAPRAALGGAGLGFGRAAGPDSRNQ